MLAEDLHGVSRSGVRTGDVYHCLIHAHIAYHGTSLAADIDLSAVVGEAAVEAVGIANRDDGYHAVLVQFRMASVTDGLTGFDGFDGEDRGLQGAHIAEVCAGEGETVQSYTQTAHVELVVREALYTGGVEDMFDHRCTWYLVT